jgi:hypothetical protein
MLIKFCFFLLSAFAISFSQNQVNISGNVLDANSNKPIKGANVKLAGKNLTSSTDTNGYFHISSTFVINSMPAQKSSTVHFLGKQGFLFRNETEGIAKICIYDLSGRQSSVIFSGKLKSGMWRVFRPHLSNGIYICTIMTPKETYSIKFLLSNNGVSENSKGIKKVGEIVHEMNSDIVAKKSANTSAIDSLLIAKDGYSPITVIVDNLIKDGLKILLTALTTGTDATIIPDSSWTCFMPEGIPPPERGVAVFKISLQYSAIHDVGITKFGHRRQFDIKGGAIKGDKIDGSFLTGGLDYELTLSNGSIELEQIDIFKVNNTPILMRNAGVAPAGGKLRVVLDFEAPNSSSYTWLNTGKFAATRVVDSAAKTINLDVYDISKTALTEPRIQIKDPANVPNQTWECFKLTASPGTTVFTENVTLGSSISIGASKRGSRNIIPITGGTTSGRVSGKILAGGADYQLNGLDARYTLAPSDTDFIIVRNCGANGLVPVFEARVAGPYAFLNENKYLSSQPTMAGSGVTITFYERK